MIPWEHPEAIKVVTHNIVKHVPRQTGTCKVSCFRTTINSYKTLIPLPLLQLNYLCRSQQERWLWSFDANPKGLVQLISDVLVIEIESNKDSFIAALHHCEEVIILAFVGHISVTECVKNPPAVTDNKKYLV